MTDIECVDSFEEALGEQPSRMLWVVKLYPCEWEGRAFRIPLWALISERLHREGAEPLAMDTSLTWGCRQLHRLRASGGMVDPAFIEAESESLQERYRQHPIPLTDEEVVLGDKVFKLIGQVVTEHTHTALMNPTCNVITAYRWAEPIVPELPPFLVPSTNPGPYGNLMQLPEIGVVHLKTGNVLGVAVARDVESNLLRVVTLHDHEPAGYPREEFLWRYSLLVVPEIAFTPDRSKVRWEELWLHTTFYWSAYHNDYGEYGEGKLHAHVAVGTSQTIAEGLPLFELTTMSPRSAVLGRPDTPTEEEFRAFDVAYQVDPTLSSEDWFSFLSPSNEQVTAYVKECKADPVRFTEKEMTLLRLLLVAGGLSIRGTLEVLATWRWETPMNIIYELDVPELCLDKPAQPGSIDPTMQLPTKGKMVLPCGEIPVIAFDRVPETERLRVVTLEESDCTSELVGLDIFKYALFEIEDNLFCIDKPGETLLL